MVRKVTRGSTSGPSSPPPSPVNGVLLEARAQRLFLAQGSFAERGLIPAATEDRRMLATDIDVLVSEYVSGVRTMLRADSSYLVAADVDRGAATFARSLGVEVFSIGELESWEKSSGVDATVWPARSDFAVFDAAKKRWNDKATAYDADEEWRWLRQGVLFVEVEGWREMLYRHLNKALRLLGELAQRYPSLKSDSDKVMAARYLFSALLVRLAQYLIAVCADVLPVPRTEREEYLGRRFAFGDQDPERAASLVGGTVAWVRKALAARDVRLPAEIDLSRLHAAPPYTREATRLVEEILSHSSEARHLVVAIEREQFGTDADDKLTRLRAAANSGASLAALLKGFVVRAFTVPPGLGDPVHQDFVRAYARVAAAAPTSVSIPPVPAAPAATSPPTALQATTAPEQLELQGPHVPVKR